MANTTYIRILQAIESFASEHLQVKRFTSDFPAQIPNFGNDDETYPILFVSPSDSIFNNNTNTFDLKVYCFDIIEKDRSNINTILSDTNSVLNDLYIWLRDGEIAGIDLLESSTAIPIDNALLDFCAGWVIDIKLEVDTYTICEIPFNETPSVIDVCNDVVYTTSLTCESLPDCPIIISIIDEVNEIRNELDILISAGTVDTYISGGTYNNNTGTATFTRTNGAQFNVTGFSQVNFDVYVTGGTYNQSTGIATYTNNTGGTFTVTGFNTNITDVYVTGGTYNQLTGIATYRNNTGGTFTVSGFKTNDIYVTGGTYSAGNAIFINNTGGTFTVTGFTSTDTFVTGGTYNGGTATFVNNFGNTFQVTGFTSTDIFTTGFTFNNSTYDLSILRNDNVTLTTNLGILATDIKVTGGTYNINTGVVTFTNNTGGTFNVTGFTSGMTDTYTTGGTYSNGTISFLKNNGGGYNVTGLFTGISNTISGTGTTNVIPKFNSVTGLTNSNISDNGSIVTINSNTLINGNVTANTVTISGSVINENQVKMFNMDMATGVYEFSGITFGTGNTFNVAPVKAYSIDTTSITNPIANYINYSGATNVATPYLLTAPATYITLTSGGTLSLLNTEPSEAYYRANILLGVIGHPMGTLTGIGNRPDVVFDTADQFRDMFRPIRLINDGVNVYANSTNLTIANTAGKIYGLGIGFVANGKNNPTSISISANTPSTFQYRTQTGTTFANTTNISGRTYDVAGIATAIGGSNNQATNQRIYLLENGNIRIQFGQTVYSTLADAIANVQTESFTVFSNNRLLGILIGILSVTKGVTNLSDTTNARFLNVSKFGESVGSAGGISTGTLQSAYNNSSEPEIVTNSTLDGITIRRGSASDTDAILNGQNGAGNITFSLNGNGSITGQTFIKSGGTSTQFLMADGSVIIVIDGGTF